MIKELLEKFEGGEELNAVETNQIVKHFQRSNAEGVAKLKEAETKLEQAEKDLTALKDAGKKNKASELVALHVKLGKKLRNETEEKEVERYLEMNESAIDDLLAYAKEDLEAKEKADAQAGLNGADDPGDGQNKDNLSEGKKGGEGNEPEKDPFDLPPELKGSKNRKG